jgi:hypothetical protein
MANKEIGPKNLFGYFLEYLFPMLLLFRAFDRFPTVRKVF